MVRVCLNDSVESVLDYESATSYNIYEDSGFLHVLNNTKGRIASFPKGSWMYVESAND